MKIDQFFTVLYNFIGMCLLIFSASCAPTIYEDPEHVDFSAEEDHSQEEGSDKPLEDAGQAYQENSYFEQGGIRLYYDPSIENYVDDTGEIVPADSEDSLYAPAHSAFADFNFSPMQAHIYVIPVDEYESAADFAPALIADLSRLIEGVNEFENCVPELPLDTFYHECGHQQFVANPAHVKFGNGSGVRFVSVYAIQSMAAVGNDNLVYVYQGFTSDGKYYIKAIVELMHAQLDGIGEIPDEVYAAVDAEEVDAYFTQFENLFAAYEGDFTPKLDWIDSIMGKLFIE